MNLPTRPRSLVSPGYLIGLLFLGITGCGAAIDLGPSGEAIAPPAERGLQEWQMIRTESGETVSFDEWVGEVADLDVVYIGEEHYNRHHVQAAVKVLQALLDRGRRPVLTIEMFGWDGQEALNRYLSDPLMDREQFLDEARWKQNWPAADFKNYQPLVQFAREHHLSMLAMNPPLSLVRKVSKQGLTQARHDAEMERWAMSGESIVDEPAYRALIMDQLRKCHGGMSDAVYERIYDASMFRDEGMAKTISTRLKLATAGEGPIVSYTGAGHVQHGLPVPRRVSRQTAGSVTHVTLYLASLERDHPEYVQEMIQETIADFIWLTPLSDHGPPQRCG